ncbi:MAG: sulfate permease [Chloroflexi bacterium]|nr:sulfate permease [Chloroflexota bacterium]
MRPLSFSLGEVSGALADIGVLVPIVAALVVKNGFNPTAVLLVFGLTYVVAGLYYRLPMPVQPLKAMAAIAIARDLPPETLAAAGLIFGAIMLVLAVSGLITPLASLFPRPVIRGIQAAVGLLLVQAGFQLWSGPQMVRDGPDVFVGVGGLAVPGGVLLAAGLAAVLLLSMFRRVPATLLLLIPAVAVGAAVGGSFAALGEFSLGPVAPALALPPKSEFLAALVLLVIPQLPLTLGNAVIAAADTARGYFGEEARRVSHRSLLVTKGFASLLAGFIGGMPVCHGSGGLTAHYRFGARTGGAPLMMGAVLLVLALGFGPSTASLFALIPLPALGVLLTIVGLQHALLARDTRPGIEWLVVATAAGVALATQNVAIGFGASIALYQLWRLPRRYSWLRARFSPERRASLPLVEVEAPGRM